MKSICVRIALKENSIDSVREWFQTLMDRREETLESLRNEGVIVESAFLDRQPNGDFLIYYMRAKDIEAARAIFQNSNLAIDAYHQDCKRKYCGVSTPLEQLFDLCVEVLDDKLSSPDKTESSFAIIKSGISQVFYGAPHENDSNPDLHLLEINKKAIPRLRVHGGFMREKFIEQIHRGRSQTQISAGQEERCVRQKTTIKDFGDILLKESKICQFDDRIGAFASRDFKKGEVVIKWNLKTLSEDEYEKLPQYEKDHFCHHRNGIRWMYPDPERHVNRSMHPNVAPDFEKQANIALRDIMKGEELSIDEHSVEDF